MISNLHSCINRLSHLVPGQVSYVWWVRITEIQGNTITHSCSASDILSLPLQWGVKKDTHFWSRRRTTEQTRWCYCEATIRENEAQSSAAVVTKMQIHKLWQYFFFHKTNNGLTVEKVSSREGHVHNYSGGQDGNSDAARVAVHYSYPSLYLGSFAQFQEKANNHISLQTGL